VSSRRFSLTAVRKIVASAAACANVRRRYIGRRNSGCFQAGHYETAQIQFFAVEELSELAADIPADFVAAGAYVRSYGGTD